MKTFSAILLVGIIAYVEAGDHPCDPFAANAYKKTKGSDMHDHMIPLEKFNAQPPGKYFVNAASSSGPADSSGFCTGATHGDKCQAVVYFRRITKQAVVGSDAGVLDLEFEAVSVGVSGTTQKAMQIKMKMKGRDSDDYIFKIAPNTQIEAFEFAKGVEAGNKVPIPDDIKDVLESELAVYYASEINGFSLYITCDGKYMWSAFYEPLLSKKDDAAVAAKLAKEVKKLTEIAQKEKGITPTFRDIPTEISDEFKKLAAPAA